MSIDDKILYRIPKEYVLKFLSIKESNMYYETFDYDYDEDEDEDDNNAIEEEYETDDDAESEDDVK